MGRFPDKSVKICPFLSRGRLKIVGFGYRPAYGGVAYNCGSCGVSFLVTYHRESGFYLKVGCALPISDPKTVGLVLR